MAKQDRKISPLQALKASELHSSRVKTLRRTLPFVVGIVVLIVVLWSSLDVFFEDKIDGLSDLEANIGVKNKVLKPKLQTTDEKGSPLTIEAESATHENENAATFQRPCCELKGPNGKTTKLTSDDGVLNQAERVFIYRGNVVLESSTDDEQSLTLKTKSARVLLDSQDAEGDDEVIGKSPMGTLTSKHGFRFDRKEQKIYFKGPSKLSISPQALESLRSSPNQNTTQKKMSAP